MTINYNWVLAEWNRFLDMSERVKTAEAPPTRNGEVKNVYSFRAPDAQIEQQLSLVRLSMERVFEDWKWPYRSMSLVFQVKEMRREIQASIPLIARSEEIDANLNLDEIGPQIAADDLHPWVWSAARPHWESGNHRVAIHAAATNVNSRLRKKLNRYDVSESRAVREAFSVEEPQPDRPRLRLASPTDHDHFKSVRVGAPTWGAVCSALYATRSRTFRTRSTICQSKRRWSAWRRSASLRAGLIRQTCRDYRPSAAT